MKAAVLTCVLAASCGGHKWHATPAQLAPLPLVPVPKSDVGPLALDRSPPATPWADLQAIWRLTKDHYLDVPRIQDEARALRTVIDTFFPPRTAETKIGVEQIHNTLDTLHRIAPYSMESVTQAYASATQRLLVCVMGAGVMGSCDRDMRPARPSAPAYEVRSLDAGIGELVVHDLSDDANSPKWRGFAEAAGRLAQSRAILVDLRDAAGNDPRALLPWVARLSGRTAIKPLRAIERPATADTYVAAYAAKFDDRGRDPDVWRTLIGESVPSGQPTRQPITVLVGRYCQSACEVIARSLQTYAHATLIGGVPRLGRAAHDEPALLYLPHSQTSVYFYATRYQFTEEVEAATGPSEEWSAEADGDGFADNFNPPSDNRYTFIDKYAFAVRELRYRLDHPAGWPRCDSLPATKKVDPFPPNSCKRRQAIISAKMPPSTMRHFLATCAMPVAPSITLLGGVFWLTLDPATPPDVLSQIASFELVDNIQVSCEDNKMVPNLL